VGPGTARKVGIARRLGWLGRVVSQLDVLGEEVEYGEERGKGGATADFVDEPESVVVLIVVSVGRPIRLAKAGLGLNKDLDLAIDDDVERLVVGQGEAVLPISRVPYRARQTHVSPAMSLRVCKWRASSLKTSRSR
jgi:hypothetical protein